MRTPGKSTLSCVIPDAVNAKISTVANGVRVILVKVAAIKLITINGATKEEVAEGSIGLRADTKACPNVAPLDNKGNMTPPGSPAAPLASAIAKNFAIPTCNAAIPDANGTFGFTFASAVIMVGIPCEVAEKAVHWPSTAH